ncbi:MAG: Hpt domain-containing protein, partial [Candidatus Competibacteraceae bacterium]|nr:Hpt domain-containing protein [Candidatus Competibacteraceae bacterium]
MDEIIVEFLTESLEGLDQLDNKFVMLEQNPDDRDTLASIFRTVHTIKGTCGFLGFSHLEKLAHAGENLLSLLRDGKLNFTQEIASALLTMLDAVRTMLGEIERTESDGEEGYANLIETLNRLKEGGSATPAPRPEPAAPPSPPPPPEPVNAPPAVNESSAAENADASDAGSELLPPGAVFLLEPVPVPEAKPSDSPSTQQPEPTATPQTPAETGTKPATQ